MKRYYYLHVWALIGHELFAASKPKPSSLENSKVAGIVMDAWPVDDLFSLSPFFYVTEKLKTVLDLNSFSEITFSKIPRIRKGANFRANFPSTNVPAHYWQMQINGRPGIDDFFTWSTGYLVVSERALELLRNNNVTNAEEDFIDIPLNQYFDSDRKYFWMEEKIRAYFIQMGRMKKE